MTLSAKEAAGIAQKHGLGLPDAVALSRLADTPAEAEEVAGIVKGAIEVSGMKINERRDRAIFNGPEFACTDLQSKARMAASELVGSIWCHSEAQRLIRELRPVLEAAEADLAPFLATVARVEQELALARQEYAEAAASHWREKATDLALPDKSAAMQQAETKAERLAVALEDAKRAAQEHRGITPWSSTLQTAYGNGRLRVHELRRLVDNLATIPAPDSAGLKILASYLAPHLTQAKAVKP